MLTITVQACLRENKSLVSAATCPSTDDALWWIAVFDAGEGGPDVADTNGANYLRTAYDQLCINYRAIDDFRAKLLGFSRW